MIIREHKGGPSLQLLFTLLQGSQDVAGGMRTLMATQLLFWMLRVPDGHAKNFSIQLLTEGCFKLTPIYDVMSTYPVMGPGPSQWAEHDIRMTMALLGKNRHYQAHAIQRRHVNSTAKKMGDGDTAEPLLQDIIAGMPAVVETVRADLPAGFTERVANKVLGELLKAA